MRRSRAIVISMLLQATLMAVPAAADDRTFPDPDDAHGPLDIERSRHAHHRFNGVFIHRIRTYETWDTSILEDGLTDVRFYFFYRGAVRRYLIVEVAEDGTPYGEMRNPNNQEIIGYAKVWRPSARGLQVEVPTGLLRRRLVQYRWSVVTNFHAEGHPNCGESKETDVVCSDVAPDLGRYIHPLE